MDKNEELIGHLLDHERKSVVAARLDDLVPLLEFLEVEKSIYEEGDDHADLFITSGAFMIAQHVGYGQLSESKSKIKKRIENMRTNTSFEIVTLPIVCGKQVSVNRFVELVKIARC